MNEIFYRIRDLRSQYTADLRHDLILNVGESRKGAENPKEEKQEGRNLINAAEWVPDFHGMVIYARDEIIRDRPEMVQRFVNAYSKAFADVVKNPQEAADIIVEANPELAERKDVLVKQIEASWMQTLKLKP